MPGSGNTSYEYLYSFKNRLKEGGNKLGCIFPLLLLGIFSLIGLLIKRDSVNPVLYIIPGVCLFIVIFLVVYAAFKNKRPK
jgi:hypothetical protein